MSDAKPAKPAESKPVIVKKSRDQVRQEIQAKQKQSRRNAGRMYSGKDLYTGK